MMTIVEAADALRTLGVRVPRYKVITRADLHAHVESLAAAHSLTIRWGATTGAAAFPWRRQITLPGNQINDELDYGVALHEISHCISLGQRGTKHEREHDAWRVAEVLALVWTDEMRAHASRCLGTYYGAARPFVRRHPRGLDIYRLRLERLRNPLIVETR
jgi:hypothetical protein